MCSNWTTIDKFIEKHSKSCRSCAVLTTQCIFKKQRCQYSRTSCKWWVVNLINQPKSHSIVSHWDKITPWCSRCQWCLLQAEHIFQWWMEIFLWPEVPSTYIFAWVKPYRWKTIRNNPYFYIFAKKWWCSIRW